MTTDVRWMKGIWIDQKTFELRCTQAGSETVIIKTWFESKIPGELMRKFMQ